MVGAEFRRRWPSLQSMCCVLFIEHDVGRRCLGNQVGPHRWLAASRMSCLKVVATLVGTCPFEGSLGSPRHGAVRIWSDNGRAQLGVACCLGRAADGGSGDDACVKPRFENDNDFADCVWFMAPSDGCGRVVLGCEMNGAAVRVRGGEVATVASAPERDLDASNLIILPCLGSLEDRSSV